MLRVSWYVATLILPALPHIATAADVRAVALVLDASGSMKENLPDGVTRMDAAKRAVGKLVSTLPGDTRLAFRAYGHQSPTKAKNCKDTALLSPFGSVEQVKDAVVAQANALVPQGYTPISYALQQAANDLTSEEATVHTVVLVSDGKETCPGDPCAVAKSSSGGRCQARHPHHRRRRRRWHARTARPASRRPRAACIRMPPTQPSWRRSWRWPPRPKRSRLQRNPRQRASKSPPRSPARRSRRRRRSASERSSRDASASGRTTSGASKRPPANIASSSTRKTLTTRQLALSSSVKGSAGGDETSLVSLSDNQYRQRGAAEFEIPEGGVTLRVGGATGLLDYWLAVTPVDAEIAVPYFVKTPAVTPLELGKPATAVLSASEPEAWFSTALEAKDYKVTAEFTRTDKASSMSANLSMFGSIGERTEGPAKVCSVTDNVTTGTCTSKLVVAQDGPVTLRVSADWKGDYKVTFKLEPIED